MHEATDSMFRNKRVRQNSSKLGLRYFEAGKKLHVDAKPLSESNPLQLPEKLDWLNPTELQQKWMDKIKKGSQSAAFDIFQEYGVQLKEGKTTFYKGGRLKLVEEIQTALDGYGPLYDAFPEEFKEHNNQNSSDDPERRWKFYAYIRKDDQKYQVIGGGNPLV